MLYKTHYKTTQIQYADPVFLIQHS